MIKIDTVKCSGRNCPIQYDRIDVKNCEAAPGCSFYTPDVSSNLSCHECSHEKVCKYTQERSLKSELCEDFSAKIKFVFNQFDAKNVPLN